MDNDDHYLAGKLLLAMPGLTDPRFERAVIFICAHDENGAMGLVVNKEIRDLDFVDLLKQLGITSNIELTVKPDHLPVMNGGPVENARGFLLHSSDFKQPDTIQIDEHISVTGTIDALKLVAQGEGPNQMLFALGYAGWGEGQLEEELQSNSWLVVDPDPSVVFAADHAQKWTRAVGLLGIDPVMLSGDAGRA